MLLALRDKQGTFFSGFIELAVAGAILAELFIEKRVYIGDQRRKLVDQDNPRPMGDPIIDECLEKITNAKRRATVSTWVPRLSSTPQLRTKVAQQLCQRGIVKTTEDKVLFIFPRTIYPEINPKPEREIISRLKEAVFDDKKAIDPRTMILVSLAHRTGLLAHNLGENEVYKARKRIDQIIAGEAMGLAARDIIDACDSAATVASLIPALFLGSSN